jgi:hypothetical protein
MAVDVSRRVARPLNVVRRNRLVAIPAAAAIVTSACFLASNFADTAVCSVATAAVIALNPCVVAKWSQPVAVGQSRFAVTPLRMHVAVSLLANHAIDAIAVVCFIAFSVTSTVRLVVAPLKSRVAVPQRLRVGASRCAAATDREYSSSDELNRWKTDARPSSLSNGEGFFVASSDESVDKLWCRKRAQAATSNSD